MNVSWTASTKNGAMALLYSVALSSGLAIGGVSIKSEIQVITENDQAVEWRGYIAVTRTFLKLLAEPFGDLLQHSCVYREELF